ncbi:hypothetical protein OUZ56_008705 [Daphnia magna]|uniref:Ribosomal RNA processing protein 1 B n=1 Tax=Daphnia magna TaxID=35525 RepID=A0ABR0ADS8_9CRUS|nr:hypothetical protein OUZ56_008705 [Daphnia magna]
MTPEVYFARKLASNEKKIRDRSLKKLRRWIAARSTVPDAFTDDELMKLWKGLFYCMWMSDKPLIQEDLAETISGLVHSIVDRMTGLKFVTTALKTMARDWSGIDTWRMDKFLMFVRRIIRHSLEYLAQGDWKKEEVDAYSKMLSEVIINANESTAVFNVPIGLQLHVTNFFPEELAKAGGEGLSSSTISKMFEPFAKCLATRIKTDILGETIEDIFEDDDDEAAVDEETSNVADLVDDHVEDDDPVRELYSSGEDHPSDENDEISDDVEDGKKVVVAPKQIAKRWTVSPSKGEIEIVIPNKKFKGSQQLRTTQAPATSENNKTNSSTNRGNRRVNFVLNKNTAQEPKDYQESLRKSPGVPHDPDRQPSGGSVLTRNDTNTIKFASSPVTRKPQRTGRKF